MRRKLSKRFLFYIIILISATLTGLLIAYATVLTLRAFPDPDEDDIYSNPRFKPDVFLQLPYIFLHLDLKGAPPLLDYLMYTLPDFKHYGVNGLLIEYEDMFPFEGKLANLSAENAYNANQLTDFLVTMSDIGLEIVPLVQTFGHLEYVLKLEEFKHLREDELYPDSICPSDPETGTLLAEMIWQIYKFHNSIKPLKFLHIGADEVMHIKKCNLCLSKKLTEVELYAEHVDRVTKMVKKISPNITVLFWNDLLLKMDTLSLEAFRFDAEPVVWTYQPEVGIGDINLYRYPKKINDIWVASAFKGAEGPTSVLPNITKRLLNHFNWLKLIIEYDQIAKEYTKSRKLNFRGIILTGWSRYNHMYPICDLFSVSIPSLTACLLLVKDFYHGISKVELKDGFEAFYRRRLRSEVTSIFKCDVIDREQEKFCSFREYRLFAFMRHYDDFRRKVDDFYSYSTNLNNFEYYMNMGIVDMNSMANNYHLCKGFLTDINIMEMSIAKYMSDTYDPFTIKEYTNYLTFSMRKKINHTLNQIVNFTKAVNNWKRRHEDMDLENDLENEK